MTDYDQDQGYTEDPDDGYSYEDDPSVRAVNPPADEAQPVPEPRRRETVIPIGEAVTPETLHGVVAFTRSVNLGTRDNNAHFRCELPFVVQPQWSPEDCAVAAADAFYQCCAVVLQQAGLPFAVGDDGVLREVAKQFPAARRVSEERAPQDEPARNGGGSDQFPHPADMRRPEHIPEGLWRDLCDTFPDGWYDNRGDKADGRAGGSSPDFKRKDDGKGLWLRPFRQEGGRGGGRGGDHARSGGNRRYEDR